jgi:hypothetical protein
MVLRVPMYWRSRLLNQFSVCGVCSGVSVCCVFVLYQKRTLEDWVQFHRVFL